MRSLIGWMRALPMAAAIGLVAVAAAGGQSRGPITAIVVRHAEKAAAPADDPLLTAAGEARARDLLAAVRDAGVSAIITTQFVRTRATAQPTAAALGLTPEVVTAGGATHAQDVALAIRKHAGQTVLVVGHSNTVPAIIEALGGKRPAAICDPNYDDLFVVTIAADGKVGVVHSRYGAPSPVDASCAGMK
jgi:broad specificity phosphatase PhoE